MVVGVSIVSVPATLVAAGWSVALVPAGTVVAVVSIVPVVGARLVVSGIAVAGVLPPTSVVTTWTVPVVVVESTPCGFVLLFGAAAPQALNTSASSTNSNEKRRFIGISSLITHIIKDVRL
jgi:hypothetical protein